MLGAGMGRHAHGTSSTLTRRRLTAREMETRAAAVQAVAPAAPLPPGEAMAMLARRGFRPELGRPDLPFPRELDADTAERLTGRLSHYSFRLFLRGAIQRRGDFAPGEATRYLTVAQEKSLADALVELGLLVRTPRARYRFVHRATSFGPTLEWYVARELRRRLGCDVATGVKFRAPGLGGDLNVIAAFEGKLIYLELKSSPPKHLTPGEVAAFFARVRRLRPDVAVFAMDTSLRLSDRVLPLLAAGLDPNSTPIGEVPTSDLASVQSDTPIVDAVRMLRSRAVRRLPVMDDGRIVGILSLGDLAVERDPGSALAGISSASSNG